MSKLLFKELLELSIRSAIEAGKEILKVYGKEDFQVVSKKDESPLTIADIRSNDVILSHLKTTPYFVLSEEDRNRDYSGRKKHETLWIVDPLDGTKEFIKRNDEFTVNIALIHQKEPVLGVVFAPVTGELFFACEGIGAYKITMKKGNPLPLENVLKSAIKLPSQPSNDQTIKVVASRSHLSVETEEFIAGLSSKYNHVETASRGSSLKLCMVAEGTAQCYPRFAPTMEWDTAAGHAICKYSGASVTDWETKKEMIYNRENLKNNWFLVHRDII